MRTCGIFFFTSQRRASDVHQGVDVEWITELPLKYPHIVQQFLTNLPMPSHSDTSLSPRATELSRN